MTIKAMISGVVQSVAYIHKAHFDKNVIKDFMVTYSRW